MQADSFTNPIYKNFRTCLKQTYRVGGFKGLFHGLGACLLRAGLYYSLIKLFNFVKNNIFLFICIGPAK